MPTPRIGVRLSIIGSDLYQPLDIGNCLSNSPLGHKHFRKVDVSGWIFGRDARHFTERCDRFGPHSLVGHAPPSSLCAQGKSGLNRIASRSLDNLPRPGSAGYIKALPKL